ncbi:hypothetical protein D9611_005665 [Ephemerocybe angulata]|uniref:Conserved oligomeric Golgi complex subunit 1 n=1 Tax=Ephemerocybe angulata TaxID=980116 RepID=A0A8H5F4I2_9AGAR|nr:hypothetical protein D9611_005665 [Tulosesus angulatus]
MYRRHSTAQSIKSAASPYANGFPTSTHPRTPSGLAPSLVSAQSSKQTFGFENVNPDELFSRYSVAEVKAIQQRLRTDADVKQEELRLMVGERYRDLLQASTSIISMAGSSQRVLEAIEECRGSIIAQEEPPMPSRTTAFGGVNDRHLQSLQLLSAHVKVLLDAPEHLWRLIERKNYLSAGWLFLFTRVVHRALAQQDDQDEDSWSKVGIDVLAEFPLVQRQWDEVSSFRSQIIHKATLSLRETGLSPQAVCSTLVTLHLLDSRPLRDAFAALLTQRTKALSALISWKFDFNLPHSANGHARFEPNLNRSTSRNPLSKDILSANEKALTAIIDTVHTSRLIFQIPPSQELSLITSVLHAIQDDDPVELGLKSNIPSDLVPSTHSLLTNSSSSAHFLLLPPSLQAYKPYIDLTSSSLVYSQADFRQVLQDWLHKSTKSWRDASSNWLSELGSVGEIWSLRTSIRKLVSDSQLDSSEKSQLANTVDGLCHDRITSVWKTTLSRAQDNFKTELASFLSSEAANGTSLFHAPPPPNSSQTSKVHDPVPFQQYQASLKRQLLGRTAQLDAVLSTLEQAARSIQKDFSTVLSDKTEDGLTFGKTVTETYQPLAESTSDAVAEILEREAESALGGSGISRLVGVANVSDELRSSSVFATHIGCRKPALDSLRSRLDSTFDQVVQQWREQTITRVFGDAFSRPTIASSSRRALGPSPQCFQSLLSLSDALRDLGVGKHNARHEPVIQTSLRALIDKYLAGEVNELSEQSLHDLAFLEAISKKYGDDWEETTRALTSKLTIQERDDGSTIQQIASDVSTIQQIASDVLIRTQTLLSLLLPCASQIRASSSSSSTATTSKGAGGNQAQLLLFGAPSSKQEYQPALELAKPSSRFGLLLVSNVEN